MACGLLVIVTRGGATEDFVPDELGFKVASELKEMEGRTLSRTGRWLVPSKEDLFLNMQRAVYDTGAVERARVRAPAHVQAKGYDWGAVVEQLVRAFRREREIGRRRRLASGGGSAGGGASGSSADQCVE